MEETKWLTQNLRLWLRTLLLALMQRVALLTKAGLTVTAATASALGSYRFARTW